MKLDSKHFLLRSNFYPNRYRSSNLRFNVLIGVGANIGNCTRRFKKLYLYLQKFPKIDIVKTSLILKNPPFGYLQQNDFYNLLIHIKTNLYPNELLLQDELEKPSILLCQQIRTISKSRLIKKLTSIDNYITQKKIVDILCLRFEDMD
jgi:hypothetical protein